MRGNRAANGFNFKPVIHAVYPLDRTAEAFAALRSRTVLGKVLVDPFEPEAEGD